MRKAIVGIMSFVAFVVVVGTCGYLESHYTREATVVESVGGIVTVVDTTDNYWAFEGAGYTKGQEVTLLMDNKHTDSNIYDDEIVEVR